MKAARRKNAAVGKIPLSTEQAVAEFYDVLLPEPDPESMMIAQDLCEEYGLSLPDLGEAMAKESFDNRIWLPHRGWADDAEYKYKKSSGMFIVSKTQSSVTVDMRPPKKGERGWWVLARTPKAALEELLVEGAFTDSEMDAANFGPGVSYVEAERWTGRSIGWQADHDYDGEVDEEGMIAVTAIPDPSYLAVTWLVWHHRGQGFHYEFSVSYRGTSWDEGVKGARVVSSTTKVDSGKRFYSISGMVPRMDPIVHHYRNWTFKNHRIYACSFAWAIAKALKENAAAGSDVVEAIQSLRNLDINEFPPPAIVGRMT